MRVRVISLLVLVGCRGDGRTVEIVTAESAAAPAILAGPSGEVDPALVEIREDAHRVMSARCGECHESHRATAKPRALAIFDLDHPDWPERFDEHRFAAGLLRFGSAPEADRNAFVALRDAELSRRH